MLPTTRANAAMQIAANQFIKAKQANPNADNEDVINNLEAVPDVIKDFLKKKVGTGSSKNANLQSDNPLMGQQQVYQDLTERLTRPFRPQMSQGRAIGGVQLPPQKALEYLHNDPDFQSLPYEYQQYAIGVVGGQDALHLHDLTLQQIKGNQTLRMDASKDALNFSESPTRMVQKNLEEGKWFVDTDNKLKKKEKNPVSGMEEISSLTPWETLHAVKESPKTGFGDLSPYINPAQAQGLQLLKDNPNASVSDIVNMVAKGKSAGIANLQNEPVSPERAATLAALNTVSPERLATMKMLGYPTSSLSDNQPSTETLSNSKAPWYMGHFNPLPAAATPAAFGAGAKVRDFIGGIGSGPESSPNLIEKALPWLGAGVVNTGALVDKGIQAGGNFLSGLFGGKPQASPMGIDFTSPARLAPAISNELRNTIPDWLVKHFGSDLSNPAQYDNSSVELMGP